eukprot:547119_1
MNIQNILTINVVFWFLFGHFIIFMYEGWYHVEWFMEQTETMTNDGFSSSDTFLDHINDYGLKLIQLNVSNSTQSVFIHPQYHGYRLHYQYHLLESELCDPYEFAGLGNVLNQYWGARAIAYFLNYDFKWNICEKLKPFPKYNDTQKSFSSFLPKQKHIYNQSFAPNLMLYADKNKVDTEYIHPSSLLFLYYNKYYAHIMKTDYENAFKEYYESNKISAQSQHKFNSDSDIVIHIRCGDVFQYMSMDKNILPQYGFLTTNYIKYSVTNGTKTAFNINWIKDKISKNTTIFILSQLTAKSSRSHEKGYAKQCNYLVKYLVNNSFALFFQPAKIEIMYDTDINNDFYFMMNAPLLICSPSSFCLSAAIANTNGYSILPSYGTWGTNLNDITNITKHYSDIYSNDMIVKHSKYLPQKHVIVESLKTKWHINNFKDYGYQIENLSKYLVDH